jgi:hypothetical protein
MPRGTALTAAAGRGHMKVVRTLLAAGADINNKITGSINTGCASTVAVARRQPEQTDRCHSCFAPPVRVDAFAEALAPSIP